MIVFAVNVHTGGGKILLDELLSSEPFGPVQHLFLDSRYAYTPSSKHKTVTIFPATLMGRLKAQIALRKLVSRLSPDQVVLLFGNWPSFFKLKCKTIIYLQNCFLLNGVPTSSFKIKERVRNLIERYLIKFFERNLDEIWVQTEWMSTLARINFPFKKIQKMPFLPKMPYPSNSIKKEVDILTVTSHSPHKNYPVFIAALKLLDKKLVKKLNVVAILDSNNTLNPVTFENINLVQLNNLSRQAIYEIYQKSKTAVISSSFESFCLPLYEALHFELEILALKAPYNEISSSKVSLYSENTAESLSQSLTSNLKLST